MQNEISLAIQLRPELKALASKRGGTIEERFWRKVYKLEGEDACWIWIAASNEHHYGLFNFKKALCKAHRVSWILENGEIPPGIDVLHKCDNPPCIRPSHLFLGDAKINGMDASKKGRIRHGEQHHFSVATEAQVIAIRSEFVPRKAGMLAMLAEKYGLKRGTVGHIVQGASWKHLPPAAHAPKINHEIANEIIKLRTTGVSTIKLAKMFHVSNSTIKNVLRKKYKSYGLVA